MRRSVQQGEIRLKGRFRPWLPEKPSRFIPIGLASVGTELLTRVRQGRYLRWENFNASMAQLAEQGTLARSSNGRKPADPAKEFA